MRRAVVFIAAGLLILAIGGPVAAEPSRNPTLMPYEITCDPGPDWFVDARGLPGWSQDWGPGDRPALLMGYTVNWGGPEPGSATRSAPPGLVTSGQLFGPCEISGDGWDPGWWITDAWFLKGSMP